MTTSTADLLNYLNALRTNADMKPLKAWKGSRAQLKEAIAKLEPPPAPVQTYGPLGDVDLSPTPADDVPVIAEAEPFNGTPIPTYEETMRATHEPDHSIELGDDEPTATTITLVEIARELGISPKVARAKIRRGGSRCVGSTDEDNYVYPIADKQKVVNFLARDFRKK